MDDRLFALNSIRYIDKVHYFDSKQGLEDLIREEKPDIMVVGSDWKGKEIVGSQFAGKVKYFERIGDYSTTNILENVK
jgi:bifunctional ADP-heptose synthase (sugar kinase/adenylyltransferase)